MVLSVSAAMAYNCVLSTEGVCFIERAHYIALKHPGYNHDNAVLVNGTNLHRRTVYHCACCATVTVNAGNTIFIHVNDTHDKLTSSFVQTM